MDGIEGGNEIELTTKQVTNEIDEENKAMKLFGLENKKVK